MMYEEAGKALQEAAWAETMEELSFVNPLKMLEGSD